MQAKQAGTHEFVAAAGYKIDQLKGGVAHTRHNAFDSGGLLVLGSIYHSHINLKRITS